MCAFFSRKGSKNCWLTCMACVPCLAVSKNQTLREQLCCLSMSLQRNSTVCSVVGTFQDLLTLSVNLSSRAYDFELCHAPWFPRVAASCIFEPPFSNQRCHASADVDFLPRWKLIFCNSVAPWAPNKLLPEKPVTTSQKSPT